MERKKRKKDREIRRRKGERKREKRKLVFQRSKVGILTVGSRRSDGWNWLDQEVKSIYSTRAMLQEVGILPTLVYFYPQGLFVKYGNAALF